MRAYWPEAHASAQNIVGVAEHRSLTPWRRRQRPKGSIVIFGVERVEQLGLLLIAEGGRKVRARWIFSILELEVASVLKP